MSFPTNPSAGDRYKEYEWDAVSGSWKKYEGDSDWAYVTFATGFGSWGSSSYPDLRYRKDKNNVLHLQGMIKILTGAVNDPICTLPVGYRPSDVIIMCPEKDNRDASGSLDSTGGAGRVDLDRDGVLSLKDPAVEAGWIYMNEQVFLG